MDEIRIFISYAREDEARVQQLYQRLAGAGFQPWLDREHIISALPLSPSVRIKLEILRPVQWPRESVTVVQL